MNPHIPLHAIGENTTTVETLVAEIHSPISAATTLHLLGDFQLILGNVPVMVQDVPRLQSPLTYLALHHRGPQSRAYLAFMLWPDSTDVQAHTNLRNLLYRLRKQLPDTEQILHIDRNTLQWRLDTTGLLDVLDFERAISRADQAEQQKDRSALHYALEQAIHVYRGDLLPGCYDEWILPERERLSQLFQSVLERLMQLLAEEGDYKEAIHVAQRILRHDPLHEVAYRNLIRLYASSGNRAAAERTFQNCVTIMERELAVGPSSVTYEIYEQYVQRDTTSTPKISSHLSFVLRVQNRWVKVSPERWTEVGKRSSKRTKAQKRDVSTIHKRACQIRGRKRSFPLMLWHNVNDSCHSSILFIHRVSHSYAENHCEKGYISWLT